jgi:hypothetical protein
MDLQGLSTNGLRQIHQAIRRALIEDDGLPKGSKKYGVRAYPDQRVQADRIETELMDRSERFTPIAW